MVTPMRVRCDLNSCRAELWSDEYDDHQITEHHDLDQLVEGAQGYVLVRDAVIEHLNPPDDDVAECALIATWIEHAATCLEQLPCTCTPEQVEDGDPCVRCRALGRLGNERVDR